MSCNVLVLTQGGRVCYSANGNGVPGSTASGGFPDSVKIVKTERVQLSAFSA